jgi:hypothetical protein
MRPLLSRLLPLMLLVAGCGHRTLITSEPPGAEVRFKGRTVGNTPLELRTVWFPGTRASFQVRMPGHRPATIRLRDDVSVWKLFGELLTPWHIPRWWNGQVRVRHEIVMVRRHGRAGTWRPEDALKKR